MDAIWAGIAKAILRATARPVCQAFLDAMAVSGVPEEVLSDNATVLHSERAVLADLPTSDPVLKLLPCAATTTMARSPPWHASTMSPLIAGLPL